MGIRIGIGSLKIGQGSTGVDWSSYWATRFPSALQAVPYSGTRMDLYWTNNGAEDYDNVSIEISTDGINFTENTTLATGEAATNITGLTEVTDYWFRVRYIKGASASAYTDVVQSFTYATAIFDGDTVGWYQFENLINITKDASERISLWKDKLGSGRDLENTGLDGTKPIWSSSGVDFNTALQTISNSFIYANPFTVYLIMKITQHGLNRLFLSGPTSNSMVCRLEATDTGLIRFYNGALEIKTTEAYTANENFVFRAGVNADGNGLVAKDTNVVTGVLGANDPGGIIFKADQSGAAVIKFKIVEAIFRKSYDYGVTDSIFNYLVKKKLIT